MRISPCGYAAGSLEEAKDLSAAVTRISHDHPEGMKGAEAVATVIYLARTGSSREEIRQYIEDNYYSLDFTIDQIRPRYQFDVTCQGSVPVALEAFLESTDFEDAIRLAISVGGDTDTIGAMTGSVAEAYYGVPEELKAECRLRLSEDLLEALERFENILGKSK
jgi:type I restriction enzyme M protein